MFEPENEWGDLEKLLETERDFYNDTTKFIGAYRDHRWIRSLGNRRRGIEYVDELFDMYRHTFDRLGEITSLMSKKIPAMEKELMVMGKLKGLFIEPTKAIVDGTKKYGRDSLTAEEAGEITYNLIPIRVYLDYRNGFNLLRTQHFTIGQPIAYLVKSMEGTLNIFLNTWYQKFKPGPVEVFGYLNFVGVDSHNNSVLPQILTTGDPTNILKTEMPMRGIERTILSENLSLKEKIVTSIKKRRPKKKKYLMHNLCNVSSMRKIFNRREILPFAKRISELSDFYIEKLNEEKEKLRQKEASEGAKRTGIV